MKSNNTVGMVDHYDIFVEGVKTHENITEEEMEEVTQDLADDFYANGWPHPKDVHVEYLGTDDD
tara:strand:- start:548 stop:739 length:192 start_codon:yes stop_codon:yes gene_type:complete